MNKAKRIITVILTAAVMLQLFIISASAASASLSVSASSLSIGDTLTVTVTFSNGSSSIGAVEGYLSFDSSVIEYTSGNNTSLSSGSKVKMVGIGDGSSSTVKFTVKFKCKAAGTSSLSLSGTVLDYETESSSSVSASKSVTVKGASALSSDATLKSLVGSYGSLTPAFSPSVTSYSVTVPNNVTVYTITANTNHSGAKTTYSGSKELKVGVNTRSVTVTAEDGVTKKTYTIKITRKEGDASSGSNVTSSKAEASSGGTSSIVPSSEFTIGDKGYSLLDEWPADTVLPAGFAADEYAYGERTIAALKSNGGTVLIYAADEYGEGCFVIYDEETGVFSDFTALEYNGESYMLTERDRTNAVPVGFSSGETELLGKTVSVWTDSEGRMLIYAVSTDGSKGFYLYDEQTGVIERYIDEAVSAPKEESEGWLDSYRGNADALFKTVVVETVIIALLLILTVTFICLYAGKCRKAKQNEKEE